MEDISNNDFLDDFDLEGKKYNYFSLDKAKNKFGNIDRLPFSLKVIFLGSFIAAPDPCTLIAAFSASV